MRVPHQTPNVNRQLVSDVAGSGQVVPAGLGSILKNVGINALKGALGGISDGL